MKDKTKGTYFSILGGSINKVNLTFQLPTVGIKIKQFLQNVANTISNDINLSAKAGQYATYEHRKRLRTCIVELKKCGFTISTTVHDNIKKLRRLEDFHQKVINLDFKGAQYPVEVWLEWKNGKNILHIHVKVYFDGSEKDGIYADREKEYSRKQLILQGFEKWTGSYHIFNSAEEGKQDLQVICTAEEVNSDTITALRVYLERISHENKSHTHTEDWSQKHPAEKMGIDYYTNKKYLSPEEYTDTAKHEFGHVLGLRDAYTVKNKDDKYAYDDKYPDIKEDIQELGLPIIKSGTNMVMNNLGPILNNDIEMMILAWQTGEKQYFHLDEGGEHISEALGR